MKYCEICGREAKEHHIVKRKPAPFMVNTKINIKHLCYEHHRTGKDAPYNNYKKDIEYKLELQKKLFELFDKDSYEVKEIQKILGISSDEVNSLVKTLKLHKEGYDKLDIVLRCMGGRLYSK
ncbi:hypothetical protein NBE98_09780 [Clostridium swellfunianum]|uniref:hypothetical protein n=1 Tax=Clostridium swellfunianum TaxID=1367462 RepID=UPI00202E2D57|nr:hypothetical protein [Clostridium swellfunianum]MCM0648663.1 hypothetical protein [Clostridium swellfunianum]